MLKRFFLVLFCVLAIPVMASHIVGGEFEIQYISGNTYRINLIIYFDKINGSAEAKDPNAIARIYRKRDNAVMMTSVQLDLLSEEDVKYTQPACSSGELKTSKLIYTTTVTLSNQEYNDPQGYYIVWERCCRNYSITNIISRQPEAGAIIDPNAAGQTFYLEFPPVVKNGKPFINSTPHLFPPLNDYACPRKVYYADFAGKDIDGDSLAYTLVTPLNTHTAEPVPAGGPASAPYPEVRWQQGFGLGNIMMGAPDLRISKSGFLTVTPTVQGLFVFAVKCEEYRNKIKIGEVRRDFQLLVLELCPRAEPPQILGKKLTDASFTYDNAMNITFPSGVADADRCITVQVSDPDSESADDNYTENITIKAIPIGFSADVSDILPEDTTAVLEEGSTANFSICFDKCPPVKNGAFTVGIVAFDDACSLPLFDTLKVTVHITPPPNTPAQFIEPAASTTTASLNEGDSRSWDIEGIDADGDELFVNVLTDGFNLADAGFTLQQIELSPGRYRARLTWDAHCDLYDYTDRTSFQIKLLLDDVDECNYSEPATRTFNLTVINLPDNLPPVIYSDLRPGFDTRSIELTHKINETVSFHVFGRDGDPVPNIVSISGDGKDFSKNTYGVSFPGASAVGTVSSLFNWPILCEYIDLNKKDEFAFQFIAVDNTNKCHFYKTDTLDVTITVKPPDNRQPLLTISSLNADLPLINNTLSVTLGQQINLGLIGTDADTYPQPDMLHLDLIEATGSVAPKGYLFAPADRRAQVETTFTWLPDCSIFENDVYQNDYTFTFTVTDDRCFNIKADTVSINMTIKDVESSFYDFLPPNIISPNNDGKNDFFAMVRLNEAGQLESILPKDNCTGIFKGVTIYNRWGRPVFESASRDFRWYAQNNVTGLYYYTLTYSNRNYKGIITVAYDPSAR